MKLNCDNMHIHGCVFKNRVFNLHLNERDTFLVNLDCHFIASSLNLIHARVIELLFNKLILKRPHCARFTMIIS